jgi:preprotein translocase subunit YajC
MSWIFLAVMFLALYFILIRPQQKRVKEHRSMVTTLAKGDEVVTNGGVLGKITKVGDSFLTLEIAQGVEITVQKHAIASLMPKGTIKSA